MKYLTVSLCCLGSVTVASLAAASSTSPATQPDLQTRIEEAVTQIRAGDLSKNATLRRMGKEAVPILIEYAQDENPDVRFIVTLALGESLDERVIPVLLNRLQDANSNVRRTAINALWRFRRVTLKKHSPDRILEALAAYAGVWDENSYKAVLLIGDLGGRSNVEALRKVLQEASGTWDKWDDRTLLGPRKKDACLRALFKLGDKKAADEVQASLKGKDVSRIVFGIEAVAYASRKDLLEQLLPFLNDDRDTKKAVMGTRHHVRVKDVALNAIVKLCGIRPSFRLWKQTRYTDDQVAEVKKLLRETQREQRPTITPEPN
jgi:HEAT repeat protein